MKRIIVPAIIAASLSFASIASAHVVVKPAQVGTAAFQTFTVGVPNEKDISTTGVRLVLPEGLKHVSPTVKPGWTVDIVKDGDVVKELKWTGGIVPAGQRDDFSFSAQAPAEEGKLVWKAYQTYEDGVIVSWDQEPAEGHAEGVTPYSTTSVDDSVASDDNSGDTTTKTSLVLSIAAAALSALAAVVAFRRR